MRDFAKSIALESIRSGLKPEEIISGLMLATVHAAKTQLELPDAVRNFVFVWQAIVP